MKKYVVYVRTVCDSNYTIEANSQKEAEEIAEQNYFDHGSNINNDDFVEWDHEIKVVEENNL